ncbi:transcriptional regulator [Sneathiella sp. P13V-1]|uniref:winged helix-turn-helix transcriptional regulator n=1 Tax=Sneathiella sp. P13V-1 TaxID=2697366 RepID=UPI00187BBE2D|nr:winged helix-turn-helix transcriptional regulator [Sneathiella sp. P13V-1]MBE7636635.1 transcriptional regulator [Sneathiella sp. P13V-1]
MNTELLVKLTSKAWTLKILSLLYSGHTGKQAPLVAATGASRTSFGASLNHLYELELIEKNPGHGHPLRPEFRLTVKGKVIASMADRIIQLVPQEEMFDLVRKSWTVPVLAVTRQPARFSAIKSSLGTITDRALSQSLGALEEREWLKREIDLSHRVPYPTYMAINTGGEITQTVRQVS